jgi:hypothetical protein
MKPDLNDVQFTEDRLATSDEIRAAGPPFDVVEEFKGEIAADFGGYVRISTAEIETTILVEELTKEQERDTWLN